MLCLPRSVYNFQLLAVLFKICGNWIIKKPMENRKNQHIPVENRKGALLHPLIIELQLALQYHTLE